ncbi:LuxR family transcriptional regulator [Paraburkholderia sp. 1N]|uniref:LuxR family transcriptional regulator n=1 Tax=Paraburkholderia solitsugae TaxID=2675748 RepID=A0ABX2C4I1_9BURK|nr:helix-turn-helix transcriptional regulator [Paraburkholderia solitsugae]NPT47884.1 LuxR family transcriptional regulator [Paraburkholderia solitsugae]
MTESHPALPVRAPLVQVEPRALGDLVHAVGTANFLPSLSAFLERSVFADAVHLERVRLTPGFGKGYVAEWLGSGGPARIPMIVQLMELYYERYYERDPLIASMRGIVGTQLIQRDVHAIADVDFRRALYDVADANQECFLVRGSRNIQYSLALIRTRERPAFSFTELTLLRQMGEFLFPLCELHASTAAVRRCTSQASAIKPASSFEERLAASEIRLSRREHEICKLLLTGKTVPEAATRLELRVSTAESYVKRAFAKLGLRTKGELFAWAHGEV